MISARFVLPPGSESEFSGWMFVKAWEFVSPAFSRMRMAQP